MAEPLVLYSTNTLIAYRINERFYGQIHYVWCSPFFSSSAPNLLDVQMPPSSTPCDICRRFLDDVARLDRHSPNIEGNRTGLQKGMTARRREGMIDHEKSEEIGRIIEEASLEDYRPLLYVIPFEGVRNLVRPAPLSERAHPFSPEYVIDRLPRSRFDVLEWLWR